MRYQTLLPTIRRHFILKQDEHELEEIADESTATKPAKKQPPRLALNKRAKRLQLTRLVAKDSGKKSKK